MNPKQAEYRYSINTSADAIQEEKMDYKLIRENFTVKKTLFDGTVQQSVELDYILPDYYPEIYKVLNLRILPAVTKQSLNLTKLEYELSAKVRLVYVSESGEISAVEQVLSYGKTQELPVAAQSPGVCIQPYTESASCRVVNKRRVDVRGIITIAVNVTSDDIRQAVSGAQGGGIQLKKTLITYPARRVAVTKRVTVVDDAELGLSHPPLKTVIRADACITSFDKKVLSGKLLTKGEAEVSLLYVPYVTEGSGEDATPQNIKFSVPFSQISDVEGLDERYDLITDASVSSCEITPSTKGANPAVSCELGIEIRCLAMRFESAELATDAFSTVCEATLETDTESIECIPVPINETHRQKSSLTYYDGEIRAVIYAGAEVGRIAVQSLKNGDTVLSGRVTMYAYAQNETGMPVYLETTEEIEHKIARGSKEICRSAQVNASVSAASFNLTSSNALEISADIKLSGYLYEESEQSFISGIILDETKPIQTDKDVAIKLYYAQKDDQPWEIAKSCHASVSAIMEENELEGERLTEPKMILIPIVD